MKEGTTDDGSHVQEEYKKAELEQDEEDEFKSCCEDEDELKEREEESRTASLEDEFSVKMYFKGISVIGPGDSSGSRLSGIGVVMETSHDKPSIRVQKKLDFYVEESVADYLALLDGLTEAVETNVQRIFAFTSSESLFNQITHGKLLENPLMSALRQRIMEKTSSLITFDLKLTGDFDLRVAAELAKVAIGIVSPFSRADELPETCSICCEDKHPSMMLQISCSHRFCSHCMKTYVEGKIVHLHVPIKCPNFMCKYFISASECRAFLPVTSYESLERALAEAEFAMTCDEYRNLPEDERDACDVTLHDLAREKGWKRCQMCRRMIELSHGCYHITCWCRHEFCYSCGSEYREGKQTCQCAFWDEVYSDEVAAQPDDEQWEAWDSFVSLPNEYSDQERSQLALIQRFLGLTDQSPPECMDSYTDPMKELRQLPWLERFLNVMSDNYDEAYI